MELPLKPIKVEEKNPKILLIYSKPKTGKTTVLASLENNLIIDTEEGTEFVEGLKIKINTLDDLIEVGKKIKEKNYPYTYITIDTVTSLEDMLKTLALKLYRETPMGKNYGKLEDGTLDPNANVLTLANGAGYLYLRMAFDKVYDYIKSLAKYIIFSGHLKDKMLEIKGKEVNAADIDLTGKIKSIICSKADAIGYLYRTNDNKCYLSFKTTDTITCGARPKHLKNKEILISELLEDDTIKTYWENIYK